MYNFTILLIIQPIPLNESQYVYHSMQIHQKIETLQIEMQDLQNIQEFLQELYNTYLMH